MEREIYEGILKDILDQIELWIISGKTPETSPFKKHYWEWVARDMAYFLCDVRGIKRTDDLSERITSDTKTWLKTTKAKPLLELITN